MSQATPRPCPEELIDCLNERDMLRGAMRQAILNLRTGRATPYTAVAEKVLSGMLVRVGDPQWLEYEREDKT